MKISTRFTTLVACNAPLQLAAMGGVGTPELAEAVAAAGGLGMVPGLPASPGACGVNFLVPFAPDLDIIVETARTARVVEFFYGDPTRAFVQAVHQGGSIAGWQVGSVDEARAAQDAGCDYVVAQGIEAGGHVRGDQPLTEVLAGVRAAVRLPVVAAGGIATAQRFADIMAMGADAVRVGTRFVTSPESGAHPDYVAALLRAGREDTVLTEWFNEGWPQAFPHYALLPPCNSQDGASAVGPILSPLQQSGVFKLHRDQARRLYHQAVAAAQIAHRHRPQSATTKGTKSVRFYRSDRPALSGPFGAPLTNCALPNAAEQVISPSQCLLNALVQVRQRQPTWAGGHVAAGPAILASAPPSSPLPWTCSPKPAMHA